MSSIVDYNTTSSNYDNQRYAVGIDTLCGMLPFYTKKDLHELSVLDAGCGTGNYANDLIDNGTRHVTLLDASEGMLGQARTKLSKHVDNGTIREVVHAKMPPLPFPDNSFDVIMFNLVLHHVQSNPDGQNYPKIEATLREARRVLKSDGIISVATCVTPLEPHWFYRINNDISRRHAKHYPSLTQWEGLLERAGFKILSTVTVKSKLSMDAFNTQMDPEGPTRKAWRNCNSYWGSATPDEIADVESKIRRLKEEGKLEQYVKDNDRSEGYNFDVTFIFSKGQ